MGFTSTTGGLGLGSGLGSDFNSGFGADSITGGASFDLRVASAGFSTNEGGDASFAAGLSASLLCGCGVGCLSCFGAFAVSAGLAVEGAGSRAFGASTVGSVLAWLNGFSA